MRTQLSEHHRALFVDMPTEQVSLLHSTLLARRTIPRELVSRRCQSGEDLFELARESGLDHAGVVLTLADSGSILGRALLERLVGRPILPWAETVRATQELQTPPPPRGAARVVIRPEHNMVVVTVLPNPKKPGSAGYDRYSLWRPGILVSEAIASGVWPADVRWDLERRFIVLAPPDSEEARRVRSSQHHED
jgi:hypothetical protein